MRFIVALLLMAWLPVASFAQTTVTGNLQDEFSAPYAPKVTVHPMPGSLVNSGNKTTVYVDRQLIPSTTNAQYFYASSGAFAISNLVVGWYQLTATGASQPIYINVYTTGTLTLAQVITNNLAFINSAIPLPTLSSSDSSVTITPQGTPTTNYNLQADESGGLTPQMPFTLLANNTSGSAVPTGVVISLITNPISSKVDLTSNSLSVSIQGASNNAIANINGKGTGTQLRNPVSTNLTETVMLSANALTNGRNFLLDSTGTLYTTGGVNAQNNGLFNGGLLVNRTDTGNAGNFQVYQNGSGNVGTVNQFFGTIGDDDNNMHGQEAFDVFGQGDGSGTPYDNDLFILALSNNVLYDGYSVAGHSDATMQFYGLYAPLTNVTGKATYVAGRGDWHIAANVQSGGSSQITLITSGLPYSGDSDQEDDVWMFPIDGAALGPAQFHRNWIVFNLASNTVNTLKACTADHQFFTNWGTTNITIPAQCAMEFTAFATGCSAELHFLGTGYGSGLSNIVYAIASTVGGGGSGSVTSVTFTGDGVVDSSTPSSAVTTTGSVVATVKTASANNFLAGPVSGSAASWAARSLNQQDLPSIVLTNGSATVASAAGWTNNANNAGTDAAGTITAVKFVGNGAGLTNTQNGWFNAVDFGADPTDSRDSWAAISNCFYVAMKHGGTVFFPAGIYTNSSYFSITNPITINGCGMNGLDGNSGLPSGLTKAGSLLVWSNTTSSNCMTFNGCQQAFLFNIGLQNNATTTSASWVVFCQYPDCGQEVDFDHVSFEGSLNQVAQLSGSGWNFHKCNWLYGNGAALYIANTVNADCGDHSISDCNFLENTGGANAAITCASSGGFKMINTKINNYGIGVSVQPSGGNTSDFQIANCSIENCNWGILSQAGDGSTWDNWTLSNIEILMNSSGAFNGIDLTAGVGNNSTILGVVARNLNSAYGIALNGMTSVHCNGIIAKGSSANAFQATSCTDCPTPTF